MPLILFDKPCNIVLVEDLFRVLTNGELFKQIELCCSQRNTFRGQQLMHHIFSHITETLRVKDLESV